MLARKRIFTRKLGLPKRTRLPSCERIRSSAKKEQIGTKYVENKEESMMRIGIEWYTASNDYLVPGR